MAAKDSRDVVSEQRFLKSGCMPEIEVAAERPAEAGCLHDRVGNPVGVGVAGAGIAGLARRSRSGGRNIVTADDEKPAAPQLSKKGEKKAQEKFARQSAALRSNLKRRHRQRRSQENSTAEDSDTDAE